MKSAAIDVEDTLADITTPFLEEFNRLYGTLYRIEHITDWGLEVIGCDLEEFINITREIWQQRYQSIPPTEANLGEKIKKIRDMGYEIHIVTARQDSIEEMKAWLEMRGIPYDEFYKTQSLNESKGRIIRSNGYSFVVDDNPRLADEVNKSGITTVLFLYDRPWNRCVEESKRVKRVRNFDEILEFLRLEL